MTSRTLLFTAALWLGACSPETSGRPPDGGVGGPTLLPRCEDTEARGQPPLDLVPSTLVGAIDPNVPRITAVDVNRNPATEAGELFYRSLSYDKYSRAPGRAHARRTALGGDRSPGARRSLAYFSVLSDFQLSDDESPARWAALDTAAIPAGLRSQEAYLPRAMSAMNATLTRVAALSRPFDFGIVTGDCADSAQLNELEWVIGIMDGEVGVHPDSGEDDDPVPGPGNDPKDPFDAVPFPAPWLYVAGNHDVEIVGIALIDDLQIRTAVGTSPSLGTRDYRQWYAPVTQSEVPADPLRIPLTRSEIVAELRRRDSGPGPRGHGFEEDADLTHGASYVYEAKPGLLRLLVLDTNDPTGGSSGMVLRSVLDGWLLPELERAEREGLLVMIASHHATTSIDRRAGEAGLEQANAVDASELEATIAAHPNVIAWLVGHSHQNRVRPIRGTDSAHPGYWEIMTSALADWPAQSRVIELVDNGNGSLSIFGTMIDFDERDCLERRFRRLALMEYVSGWWDDSADSPEGGNVELILPTPAGATAAISAATAADRIESRTSLADR